jgi:hypothetical protein
MVTGPGDELGAAGRGHLRASHADREQVIGTLKAAFVQGRLDRDEFDRRVGQAFASRTYLELAAVTADLPAGLAAAQLPGPVQESVNKKAVAAMACATAACIGVWYLTMLTPDGSPFAVPVIVAFFLFYLAVPTGWLVLLHTWLDKRAGRPSAQGQPPGAGGQASPRLSPAGSAGQLPLSDPGHRHTADAAPVVCPRLVLS